MLVFHREISVWSLQPKFIAGKHVPRAVFVDLEPTVVGECRRNLLLVRNHLLLVLSSLCENMRRWLKWDGMTKRSDHCSECSEWSLSEISVKRDKKGWTQKKDSRRLFFLMPYTLESSSKSKDDGISRRGAYRQLQGPVASGAVDHRQGGMFVQPSARQ